MPAGSRTAQSRTPPGLIRGFVQYLDAGIAQPGEHLVQVAGAKVHCVERTLGEHHPHGVEVARRTLHIVAEHHIDARLVRSADGDPAKPTPGHAQPHLEAQQVAVEAEGFVRVEHGDEAA